LWILAPEKTFLIAFNDHFVLAEWALFETLEAGGFNVLPLLEAFVEDQELGSQETLELRL
jgi:hypothetical protein